MQRPPLDQLIDSEMVLGSIENLTQKTHRARDQKLEMKTQRRFESAMTNFKITNEGDRQNIDPEDMLDPDNSLRLIEQINEVISTEMLPKITQVEAST